MHSSERAAQDYLLYGMRVRSDISLPYPPLPDAADPDVTISIKDQAWFSTIRQRVHDVDWSSGWYEYARLEDDSDLLRWPSLFEFAVSPDGGRVAARPLENATAESLHSYLLGWILSFALLKQGYEPLHATAVVVDGKAVAFVGDSGAGKSTLAASFLQAGHRLLTDDLLLIQEVDGELCGFPGPPRIKLFPHVARCFHPAKPSLGAMNANSDKILLSLGHDEVHAAPAPVHRVIILDGSSSSGALRLEELSRHQSFLALIAATFNDRLRTADRLARQFRVSATWADRLAVCRMTYPRALNSLREVRELIVADLCVRPSARS